MNVKKTGQSFKVNDSSVTSSKKNTETSSEKASIFGEKRMKEIRKEYKENKDIKIKYPTFKDFIKARFSRSSTGPEPSQAVIPEKYYYGHREIPGPRGITVPSEPIESKPELFKVPVTPEPIHIPNHRIKPIDTIIPNHWIKPIGSKPELFKVPVTPEPIESIIGIPIGDGGPDDPKKFIEIIDPIYGRKVIFNDQPGFLIDTMGD